VARRRLSFGELEVETENDFSVVSGEKEADILPIQ